MLLFDAFSGISGDMTLAALLDLGVPIAIVHEAIAALGLKGVELRVRAERAGSIGALTLEVRVAGRHPERSHASIARMILDAPLHDDVKRRARAIFDVLGEAEARVHRVPLDEVHFHEVGAVDSIVDIVGAAACLSYLQADVLCTPLPIARGFVESQHGMLPLPAPATLECLRGVPTYDAGIEGELVTPTGAAIVRASVRAFVRWPELFAPQRIGWGKGSKSLRDRPNALRVVLGELAPAHGGNEPHTHAIVEANVDDMTGELASHAVQALRETGALDVWTTAITMKKGRPGFRIAALSTAAMADAISEVLLRETTTIGVRRTPASRVERPRELVQIQTVYGPIQVKVSGGPFGAPQVKPEFDECARAARAAGVSVREVLEAVRLAAAQQL